MSEKKEFKVENRHIRALTAIFLLAPIIPHILKRWNYDLSDEDIKFIQNYIKYWNILLVFFVIYIILWIFNFLNWYNVFLYYLNYTIILLIVAGIITWIFFIFQDKNIIHAGEKIMEENKIQAWNIDILFYYIPLYNLFLRYYRQKNDESFRWIKESIIFMTLYIFFNLLVRSALLNFIFLIAYAFRIISLIWGVDIIDNEIKRDLNEMFKKNPEEIFAYIKWSILYLFEKLKAKNLKPNTTLSAQIENSKKAYQELNYFQIDDTKSVWGKKTNIILIMEYIILVFLSCSYIYFYVISDLKYDINGLIYSFPFLLLIWRYLLMWNMKKLPHIPVLYEISLLITKLFKL